MGHEKINEKQKRFAEVWLVSQDRRKALEAGGYSLKNVDVASSQLLHNPKIMAYLEERSKLAIVGNQDEIYAIVKGLDKKDEACAEVLRCYRAIKDEKNPTKYKYLELLLKLKGHFNENGNQLLFSTLDGKPLGISDIMEGTSRLTGVMREIRFEAEIMRKSKEANCKLEPITEVIDITPVTNDDITT